MYYSSRCSSEMVELVPLPYFCGRSTCYSDRLHVFPVTIPKSYRAVYVSSFFPCKVRLRNSLPLKCFLLNSYLNGLDLMSRDSVFCLRVLSQCLSYLLFTIFFFFFVTPCLPWSESKLQKNENILFQML